MLTRKAIRVVYDPGTEAIMARVARWCAGIDQPQAQIAAWRARLQARADQAAPHRRPSRTPPSSDRVTPPPRAVRLSSYQIDGNADACKRLDRLA